ncbi:MAG TPA: hydrogenase maturation nickel metallochaperone HypA [Rhodopseudomonas sp.]|uniref:hydrogenase maturation nickel metallochaperone HypA/HybF n=1 Tax=Rhodopseudomonas sp. TaxID=1078 RepID=UPI002EDB016D
MHEITITCALMRVVNEEVLRRGGGKVSAITMTIGGLQGIEPRVLQSSFDLLAEDTNMAGALLRINRRPVRVFCRDCQDERVADQRFRCGSCQGSDVSMLPSEGMTVDEIVVCA